MRSILIIAAGLLQFSYGAVLPSLGTAKALQRRHHRLARRALLAGTPVLQHGSNDKEVKAGDVFDFVGPKVGSDFKRNVQAIQYQLTEIADKVRIALVKPAGSGKASGANTITVTTAKGTKSTHEVVGDFTNEANDEPFEEQGEHSLLLSRLSTKKVLPDGKFQIAMEASLPGQAPTTFLSPQFEVKKSADAGGAAKTQANKAKKPPQSNGPKSQDDEDAPRAPQKNGAKKPAKKPAGDEA